MNEIFSHAKHWTDCCPTEEEHVAETTTKERKLSTTKEQHWTEKEIEKERHFKRRAAMGPDRRDAGADGSTQLYDAAALNADPVSGDDEDFLCDAVALNADPVSGDDEGFEAPWEMHWEMSPQAEGEQQQPEEPDGFSAVCGLWTTP